MMSDLVVKNRLSNLTKEQVVRINREMMLGVAVGANLSRRAVMK